VESNSLKDLYVDELRDLYDAEHQIIKALPRLIDAASSDELQSALNEHLEITKQQAERLEQIFESLGEKAKGKKCKGMEGLIKEGSEVIEENDDEQVRDAGIISAAQRVEHYEMAGYGTVRTYASLLGEDEAADLLQQTLDEEKEADDKLTQLAEQINVEAAKGETVQEKAPARKSASKSRRVA
jgi:ferritin-like metal-binding protein YciE